MKHSGIFILFFITLGVLGGCADSTETAIVQEGLRIFCGAEIQKKDAEGQLLLGAALQADTFWLSGSNPITDEDAHTGKFAVVLSESAPFAMTYRSLNMQAGQTFRLTAWRKGPGGAIVVSAATTPAFYQQLHLPTGAADAKGWEPFGGEVMLPPHLDGEEVRIYLFNDQAQPVLMDDFTIQETEAINYPAAQGAGLQLVIPDSAMEAFMATRKTAFQKGVLEQGKEDWQQAMLFQEEDSTKVKLRLKGDWLDHLQNDKWSFRIKTKNEEYNIQTPKTRDFMREKVLRMAMRDAGIIAPEYEFVHVTVNNRSKGIYAKEAHFTQAMLRSQERPEGPIVRLTEDHKWDFEKWAIENGKPEDLSLRIPVFEAAVPDAFDTKYWKSDSTRKVIHDRALMLLRNLQTGNPKALKHVDVQKMARFIALCDALQGWHGLAWHNMRFYYNPETDVLEPIAFDHFTEYGHTPFRFKNYVGQHRDFDQKVYFAFEYFILQMFNNPAFEKAYQEALAQYAQRTYWEEKLREWEPFLVQDQAMLLSEFPNSQLDVNAIYAHADSLNKWIGDAANNTGTSGFEWVPFKWPGDTCLRAEPFADMGLQVFAVEGGLEVYNHHCETIHLTQLSTPKNPDIPIPVKPVFTPHFSTAGSGKFIPLKDNEEVVISYRILKGKDQKVYTTRAKEGFKKL